MLDRLFAGIEGLSVEVFEPLVFLNSLGCRFGLGVWQFGRFGIGAVGCLVLGLVRCLFLEWFELVFL